jgi:hypothetical protein
MARQGELQAVSTRATISFYVAIFLTTLSLLYLEVFSVRIIAIVLNDNVIRGGSGNLNSSDKWNFGLYLA